MSREFNGSSQWLNHTTPMVTTTPFSVSAWINTDVITAEKSIWWCGRAGVTNQYYELGFRGHEAGDYVECISRSASGSTWAVSTVGVSQDTWTHCAGVWTSNTDRKAYQNGGNEGTNTTDITVSTPDESAVGRSNDSTPDKYFDGSIAEIGVWNVALTTAEIAMLGDGYSPLFVRPASLIGYLPLIRDEDEDRVGGLSFTANGSPTIDTHPPMKYPTADYIRRFAAAVVGGTSIKTLLGLAEAQTKAIDDLANASMKTWAGLA